MGGAYQRNIDLNGSRTAKWCNAALLQYAQKASLEVERHVADFIKEKRAAVRLLNFAGCAFLASAGKGAALVTKKLGLNQGFRNRGAVQCDERAALAGAAVVEALGEYFLAGARFALNQDWYVTTKNPSRPVDRRLKPCIASVQGIEIQLGSGRRDIRAPHSPRCRGFVVNPPRHRGGGDLTAQLNKKCFAANGYFAASQLAVTKAVDKNRQAAFEDHREVSANGINLADTEDFQAIPVDCQYLPIR